MILHNLGLRSSLGTLSVAAVAVLTLQGLNERGHPDLVTTRGIVITGSDGERRMLVGDFAILDPNDQYDLSESVGIALLDGEERVRAVIGCYEDGTARIDLVDRDGIERLTLAAKQDNYYEIACASPTGAGVGISADDLGARLELFKPGAGVIKLSIDQVSGVAAVLSRPGNGSMTFEVAGNGAGIQLMDEGKRPRLEIGVKAEEGGVVRSWSQDGESRRFP